MRKDQEKMTSFFKGEVFFYLIDPLMGDPISPNPIDSGVLPSLRSSKQYPYTKISVNRLLEQWIEYDLAGRVNP